MADGPRNDFTGDNEGFLIQAGHITVNLAPVDKACERPLDVGDIRLRDGPLELNLGEPLCLGRDKELDQLADALGGSKHVLLHGPTGIGKTTLLRHAAHKKRLAVPDMRAIVVTPSQLPDADGILRAVLAVCGEYPRDRHIPPAVATQALAGYRALVIVEDPRCTAEDLAEVLGAMPRSVFVISTDRSDLGPYDVEMLLAGLPVRASRQLLRSRFDGRLPAATRQRVEELCKGYGYRPDDVARLGHYLAVARKERKLVPELDTDEAQLIVPRLVEWLDEPARAAVLTLAALDRADWGWPALAAVAGIPTQATATLLKESALVSDGSRFRLAAGVFEHVKAQVDVVAVTEGLISWVTETVDPQQIAAEITVIEQALLVNLDDRRPDLALALARVAATKLVSARHWGAWGRVLTLGLRAAVRADSVRDQVYFRYSIAARKYADGRVEEAFELVVALMSTGLDGVDTTTTDRVRRLADQVGYRDDGPTEPVTGLLGLLRQAPATVLRVMPAPVQQFVAGHPEVLRAAGVIAAVAVFLAALLTSSGYPPIVEGDPDPHHPIVVTTTTPPTSGVTAGPTVTGTPPATGTSHGPAPTGDPTHGGGQLGAGPTQPGQVFRPSPPPTTLSWGFARDDSRRADGQPDDLTGPSDPSNPNYQANWTWGIWNMQSPPPTRHPTGTRLGTGRQQVRMPQAGTPGGTVVVTALDTSTTGKFCQPEGWYPDGGDEVIDVRCFTKAGAAGDVPFFVFFAAGSGNNPIAAAGTRSYVVDNQPTASAFTPDWQHGRNAGPVVRTGVGNYTADLAGAATGVVELAAVGADPRHCSVTGRHGDSVDIACVDPQGSAADTAFAAGVASGQNLLDDNRKPVGDYVVTGGGQWGPGTVTRTATGKYTAQLGNGYTPSTMHVTAEGVGNYCSVANLNETTQNNSNIYLACYTANGTPTDTALDLLYASTRIY